MTTIYIVMSGDCSDYKINAVFSTRDLAEQFVALHNAGTDYNDMNIEEWLLDPDAEALRQGMTWWDVTMDRDGSMRKYSVSQVGTTPANPNVVTFGPYDTMYTTMQARDRQHAIKIANERRTHLLATNQWPE